jgi:hypothetical protein
MNCDDGNLNDHCGNPQSSQYPTPTPQPHALGRKGVGQVVGHVGLGGGVGWGIGRDGASAAVAI